MDKANLNEIALVVTTCIAVYGAIVSTVLAIHELLKNKPRLKVTVRQGEFYDRSDRPSEPVIVIEAVNKGAGKIALTHYGFSYRNGEKQIVTRPFPAKILPTDLDERKKCAVGYPCRGFRENLDPERITGVFFQDQTEKKWTCRISRKKIHSWLALRTAGWRLDISKPPSYCKTRSR
jgi:hypothetical protein